jgi:hypothetical protein
MLEGLLGNKSAEKVMLSIFNFGELHASAIAKLHSKKKHYKPMNKEVGIL